MPWYGWVVLADLAVSGLFKITQVGKRRTVTAMEAMLSVVEIVLLIWAVVALAHRASA